MAVIAVVAGGTVLLLLVTAFRCMSAVVMARFRAVQRAVVVVVVVRAVCRTMVIMGRIRAVLVIAVHAVHKGHTDRIVMGLRRYGR